jgi:hypothetical protein
VRALSLLQPWASLVASGDKRIETRSWRRSVADGERIAIHASKGRVPNMLLAEVLHAADRLGGDRAFDFIPRGAIVATCRVAFIVQAIDDAVSGYVIEHAGRDRLAVEKKLGDWSHGRWLWALADVRRLAEPVRCDGMLGLWRVPDDVAARVGT